MANLADLRQQLANAERELACAKMIDNNARRDRQVRGWQDRVETLRLKIADAEDAADLCPVCDEPLKTGDICATDIELGTCHAACLEGSPTVNLDTGEPSSGPIATFPYEAGFSAGRQS